MAKKKRILNNRVKKSRVYKIILLLFLFGATIGFLVGKYSATKKMAAEIESLRQENARLDAEIEKIKVKFPPAPQMSVVLGKVTEIGVDFLTVQINQSEPSGLSIDFFEEIPMTRKVLITKDTKISKFLQRSPEEMRLEAPRYKAYNITENNSSLYTHKEITISIGDVHVGDIVVVDAGKDIKMLSEFTAEKIFLQ